MRKLITISFLTLCTLFLCVAATPDFQTAINQATQAYNAKSSQLQTATTQLAATTQQLQAATTQLAAANALIAQLQGQNPPTTQGTRDGVNMSGNAYWTSFGIWNDVSHGFSQFWSDDGSPLTAKGFPTGKCHALCAMDSYDPGDYAVVWTGGTADVTFNNGTFDENPNRQGGIWHFKGGLAQLVIQNVSAPITSFHIYAPGTGPNSPVYNTQVTAYLSKFKGGIRTICLQGVPSNVNSNAETQPSDRPLPDSWEQTGTNGVALELIRKLGEEAKVPLWISIPYKLSPAARQAYYQVFKGYAYGLYIQFDNEVWNFGYASGQWCLLQAQTPKYWFDIDANGNAVANQNVDINLRRGYVIADYTHMIGREIKAAGLTNAHIVLCTQLAWPAITEAACKYSMYLDKTTGVKAIDSIAPALYFSSDSADGKYLTPNPTVADLVKSTNLFLDNEFTQWCQQFQTYATTYGKTLYAYEGGQSEPAIVPPQSENQWNDPTFDWQCPSFINDPHTKMQSDPAMFLLEQKATTISRKYGFTVQMHFSLGGYPSRWGYWGADWTRKSLGQSQRAKAWLASN